MPKYTTLTVGLSILAHVSRVGGASSHEVAARFEMPDSTVYRYLQQLVEAGYLYRGHGCYYPGSRYLVEREWERPEISACFTDSLAELTADSGLTSSLTTRIGRCQLCLAVVPARDRADALRLSLRVGELRPLYAGSSADLLLALAPDDVVESVTSNRLRKFTGDTPSGRDLSRRIASIREERLVVTLGELTPKVVSAAVPVTSASGTDYALSVAGSETRMRQGDSSLQLVIASLRATARVIEEQLAALSADDAELTTCAKLDETGRRR
jgi:DNA-binding IclR family transcriptional regulator